MDAANASMYDGATAAAEAVHLAASNTKKNRVIISDTVSPLFRDVISTYLCGQHIEIIVVPNSNGKSDFNKIKSLIDDNTAALLLAQPNFFGIIDDVEMGAELIHKAGGLLIMAVDPVSAFVLRLGRLRRRYCRRRRPAVRNSAEFRRTAPRLPGRQKRIGSFDTGPYRGSDRR